MKYRFKFLFHTKFCKIFRWFWHISLVLNDSDVPHHQIVMASLTLFTPGSITSRNLYSSSVTWTKKKKDLKCQTTKYLRIFIYLPEMFVFTFFSLSHELFFNLCAITFHTFVRYFIYLHMKDRKKYTSKKLARTKRSKWSKKKEEECWGVCLV